MNRDKSSLWELCCQAVDATLDQGTTFEGITIDRVMRNLKEITNASEWKKKDLFNVVVNHYIRIYFASIGYRSGIKEKCVYFSEDSIKRIIGEGLAINQEDLANSHLAKAEELKAKVVMRGMDGQVFSDGNSIYEEVTLDTLVNEIKRIESESA